MKTTQDRILDRIRRQHGGDGAVVTPKDFLDLAGRDAIDQALARLVRAGALTRLGRGLYHRPRANPSLGIPVPPDPDRVADALGRQTGSRVAPTPAVTANRLGLSTQIPAKPVYLTTGRSRTVRVGSRTYRLKHVDAGRLPDTGSPVGRALQAIEAAGPNPDGRAIATIRRTLTPGQQRQLVDQARYAAGWVADTAKQVASDSAKVPSRG